MTDLRLHGPHQVTSPVLLPIVLSSLQVYTHEQSGEEGHRISRNGPVSSLAGTGIFIFFNFLPNFLGHPVLKKIVDAVRIICSLLLILAPTLCLYKLTVLTSH